MIRPHDCLNECIIQEIIDAFIDPSVRTGAFHLTVLVGV